MRATARCWPGPSTSRCSTGSTGKALATTNYIAGARSPRQLGRHRRQWQQRQQRQSRRPLPRRAWPTSMVICRASSWRAATTARRCWRPGTSAMASSPRAGCSIRAVRWARASRGPVRRRSTARAITSSRVADVDARRQGRNHLRLHGGGRQRHRTLLHRPAAWRRAARRAISCPRVRASRCTACTRARATRCRWARPAWRCTTPPTARSSGASCRDATWAAAWQPISIRARRAMNSGARPCRGFGWTGRAIASPTRRPR